MGAEQSVFANLRAVADLYQVVDLDAAPDAGFADAGAIDAGVGLHLHVVFDDDRGRLGNLVPVSVVSFGEAKAVGADHDSVLQQHVVADAAVLADDRVRVREEVVADLHSAIDHNVRQQDRVVADLDVLVDDHDKGRGERRVQSSPWDGRPLWGELPGHSAAVGGRVRGHARS